MKTFADQIIHFYSSLRPPKGLHEGIGVLFPQQQPEVIGLARQFFKKYYSDNNQRTLLFGINPGRFGAGVTGINFTATRQLTENCGITHPHKMQSELSAEFIYEMIEKYGGPDKFYGRFFISAISPLGFVRNGKNLNYYDEKDLQTALTPFIIDSINEQVSWNVNRRACICIGGEKNYSFFSKLNETNKWFERIIPVAHPRFIMQYRRKTKNQFIEQYLQALDEAC